MPETSLLQMAKDAMIGSAKLAAAMLGTSTIANGFAVTPTGPASLQIVVAPGEIYAMANIDSLAFSTLPADTTHSILKQGIMLDGVTLSCPAPGTTDQSINYLVQVTYQDSDASPVLLPYYNSSNPAMPYSGQGNNGLTQNTVRKGVAVVSVKAGASATTGSQTTPAPDAGYIGLYVVTVAFGQTTINSGNIAVLSTAPLINSTLHGLSPVFTANPVVPTATLPGHAMPLGQAVGRLIGVQVFTASATYTPTLGTSSVVVEMVGGGGGGGGAGATDPGVVSLGAGGGSGGYAKSRFLTGFSGASVVIGLGGGGGSDAAPGGNGAASSFAGSMTASGGGGGPVMAPTSTYPGQGVGGTGGGSSGGNILTSLGSQGGTAIATTSGNAASGNGGASVFSGGGSRAIGSGSNGTNGFVGSGGSGAISQSKATAYSGGNGGSGLCIVWEYS